MNQLLIQIIGGLIVMLIAAWFGIGGAIRVIIHSGKTKKNREMGTHYYCIMTFGGATR